MDAIVRLGDVETAIKRQVYLDFDRLSKFVGYYISAGSKTYEICEFLASQSEDTLKALEAEMKIQSGFVGQRDRRGIADLKFVQQVVIYHEDNLTSRQAVDLEDSYKKRGLALVLRGPEYLSIKSALQGGSS
jgi:hypothetical protein